MLSIGSLYSNGFHTLADGEVRFFDHTAPVPLAFERSGALCFLDCSGRIFDAASGDLVTQIALVDVFRARVCGGTLLAVDYTQPSSVLSVDLQTFEQKPLFFQGVFIVNDILMRAEDFVFVDKQQGKLFQYDHAGSMKSAKLGFGNGRGQLYDPIAVRASRHDDKVVEAVSWPNSKIVSCTMN